MRKLVFFFLCAVLAALVAARAMLPEPAQPVSAAAPRYGYNILPIDLPIVTETAGSGLIAEMNAYYLFRTPTTKSALTGALRGKNLVLVCANDWRPDGEALSSGALERMAKEGARFSSAYRPDWYQDMDGHEFALLSGLMPTNVYGESAFAYAGEQSVCLPFALPRCLAAEGYACYAFSSDESRRAAYAALGFSDIRETDADMMAETLASYTEHGPFFAYYTFAGAEAERAVGELLSALDEAKLADTTAVCVLTADAADAQRAHLFLRDAALAGVEAQTPCSELDLTPTLLNLFGVDFDSRFLSGRDIFAGNTEDMPAAVSLYGSAYSDWVTEAGRYSAAEHVFRPVPGETFDEESAAAYVHTICLQVYDRYIYARRVMENNYFALVPGI